MNPETMITGLARAVARLELSLSKLEAENAQLKDALQRQAEKLDEPESD